MGKKLDNTKVRVTWKLDGVVIEEWIEADEERRIWQSFMPWLNWHRSTLNDYCTFLGINKYELVGRAIDAINRGLTIGQWLEEFRKVVYESDPSESGRTQRN